MNTFIGVDLGRHGKPSDLASIGSEKTGLRLRRTEPLKTTDEIPDWIQAVTFFANGRLRFAAWQPA